mmetsp:Transcript_4091/g.6340  ORF Transcript_4091/g.6340 Transcript_4091/m.6340 type:complete len:402 (+) Transcript_4091:49-1254(+)
MHTVYDETDISVPSLLIFIVPIGVSLLQISKTPRQDDANKIILAISVSVISWWMIGYGLAHGRDKNLFVGSSQFATKSDADGEWFASWAYCMVCLSITSMGIGNRIDGGTYITLCVLHSAFVFPFIFHWVWGGGWATATRSTNVADLLAGCGVMDQSGSGAVFFTAGVTTLVVCILNTKRDTTVKVRYDENFHLLGTLVMWFGWYGMVFDSRRVGSTSENEIYRLISNATMSSASGFLSLYILSFMFSGSILSINLNYGPLSGLAAIGSGCGSYNMGGSLLIGAIAGSLTYCATNITAYLKVDSDFSVIPVFFVNGAWGLLAAGLFTTKEYYRKFNDATYNDGSSRADHCAGLFYGGEGHQLAANFCFLFALLAWNGAIYWIFSSLTSALSKVRATNLLSK